MESQVWDTVVNFLRGPESQAFRLASHGRVSDEVFEQEGGLIRIRRRCIAEQRRRLEAQLADLERYSLSPETISSLRQRLEGHLAGATLLHRRFVLEAVGAKVVAQGNWGGGGGNWNWRCPVTLNQLGIVNTKALRPPVGRLHL